MADGRTIWWSKDSEWWGRELIVILGEEFGPEGPAVIDWLSCAAKKQNDGGYVKTGPRAIARGCFASLERIPAILSRSVTLGLLDDYTEQGQRFTCRISGWKQDQDRAQAAIRQTRKRSTEPKPEPLSRSVTVGHGESHTGQDRSTSTAASARASHERLQGIFEESELHLDDVTAARVAEAFADSGLDLEHEARGCAVYLREDGDPATKPVGRTFWRWLENARAKRAAAPETAGRTKSQREADDLAALQRLSGGAA